MVQNYPSHNFPPLLHNFALSLPSLPSFPSLTFYPLPFPLLTSSAKTSLPYFIYHILSPSHSISLLFLPNLLPLHQFPPIIIFLTLLLGPLIFPNFHYSSLFTLISLHSSIFQYVTFSTSPNLIFSYPLPLFILVLSVSRIFLFSNNPDFPYSNLPPPP